MTPRTGGLAATYLSSGMLYVETDPETKRGGENRVAGFYDDFFVVQSSRVSMKRLFVVNRRFACFHRPYPASAPFPEGIEAEGFGGEQPIRRSAMTHRSYLIGAGRTAFHVSIRIPTSRRIKKSATNSGDFDAVTRYYYDGQKIVKTRLGEQTTYHQQFIHGTQYIDELVMIRVKGKGDLYVHQDANWNVIGLTDLGGRLVERYVYRPYGEVTVYQENRAGRL